MEQQANLAAVAFLVKGAIRREVTAFEQLYELFIDRIYRYLLYRVGDGHLAEDLTSAVFLKAWQSIEQYQERGVPFSAWLYRIARNVATDQFRTSTVDIPLDGQEMLLPAGAHIEDWVQRRFTQEQIRGALGALTEDQRQVIILHFFEGLSYSEIAEVMGKQEGAVRTIQYRALKSLRVALAQVER